MTGQNTEKQILAMVLLLILAVGSLGAYTWYDNGRRTEAESEVFERDSERGAHTFARNCRVCHGNDGRGSASASSLVGPALNTPANTFAWRTDNVGQLQGLQNDYRFTISCGRNGTAMPPWSLDQGGSLNDFQIDNLVTLITTNAGDAWHVAVEAAIHEDELAIDNLRTALDATEATLNASGWFADVEAAQGAVARVEADDAALTGAREAVAAAQESETGEGLDEAQAELTALERAYTNLVLAAVTIRTATADTPADQLSDARQLLADASPVEREIAQQRAWLRVASAFRTAEKNLSDAEQRFADGLPIDSPATQVTAGTCGQVHGLPGGSGEPADPSVAFGAWLDDLPSDG